MELGCIVGFNKAAGEKAKAIHTGPMRNYHRASLFGIICAEVLKLLKKFYDNCATPNWSGIKSQGAFTGGTDFPGGKAAMAWGTNFATTGLADAGF